MSVAHSAPTAPPVHHPHTVAIAVGAVALAFVVGIGAGVGLEALTQTPTSDSTVSGIVATKVAVPGVAENNMSDAVRLAGLARAVPGVAENNMSDAVRLAAWRAPSRAWPRTT